MYGPYLTGGGIRLDIDVFFVYAQMEIKMQKVDRKIERNSLRGAREMARSVKLLLWSLLLLGTLTAIQVHL